MDSPLISSSPLARAALAYASRGWPVLPCKVRGKTPLTSKGFHDATADPETIAAWWRERSRAGEDVRASVVCTTSTSGLAGNPGQANYGAAKAGVAALTVIAAAELARHGVRVNAIAPLARTRLTAAVPA